MGLNLSISTLNSFVDMQLNFSGSKIPTDTTIAVNINEKINIVSGLTPWTSYLNINYNEGNESNINEKINT